ncbi:MAG: hypothetical protein CVT94_16320 [Bacteroidetes bacterium HGW-Bacteroidetes-11]|jgi:hypothetical protein|nr:MAG: hypothetical protein CVT94_16320 [Bacteroidetes bacterium HGW-Bacteroidetes-11]
MDDQQTVQFIIDIFDLIKKSKTIVDLESIPDKMSIPIKNRMNTDGYPKIEYKINQAEIKSLLDNKILDNNLNFTKEITSKLTDPLTKLLYAISWKNGDLKKVKHIVKGILESEKNDYDQDEALVFYQFGKYLTKTPGQPIIDQHVIRAFAIYKLIDIDQTKALRQIEIIDKRHKIIISQYKEWLTSDELTHELRNETDYTYHIDKLLFATGKTIKNRS